MYIEKKLRMNRKYVNYINTYFIVEKLVLNLDTVDPIIYTSLIRAKENK